MFGFGFRVALLSAWLSRTPFYLFIYFGVIKFHALFPFFSVSVPYFTAFPMQALKGFVLKSQRTEAFNCI